MALYSNHLLLFMAPAGVPHNPTKWWRLFSWVRNLLSVGAKSRDGGAIAPAVSMLENALLENALFEAILPRQNS